MTYLHTVQWNPLKMKLKGQLCGGSETRQCGVRDFEIPRDFQDFKDFTKISKISK